MSKKLPRLTEQIANRVRKADYVANEAANKCFICGNGWAGCPHNWADIELVVQATKMLDVLGIKLG